MRKTDKEAPELDITAFLNLMVVLVPFLLITAVFSRITVLQINLPEEAGATAAADIGDQIDIEVIVRSDRVQIGDGNKVLAQFMSKPNPEGEEKDLLYDWASVNTLLATLRQNLPDKTDALILMENGIKYDYMVQAMDTVRIVVQRDEDGAPEIFSLFPDISFGDAPDVDG